MKNKVKKNTTQNPFKKAGIVVAICLLAYACYTIFYSEETSIPPQDIKVVEVEEVKRQDIQEIAEFIGTIKAEKKTQLIAKSRGILERHVNSGQMLKAGDLLAKIDNKDIEHDYKLSQDMEKIAKTQYERLNKLMTSGVSSRSAVEEKESLWIEYQRKLSDAKKAFDDINITAPFDGIVGIFKVREGSQVQEGDLLFSFYDPSTTIVEFDVPISTAYLVQDGAVVYVNNQQYTLTHIQKMLDEETHMSPAYTNIDCEACIIGDLVDVDLVIREESSVITVPYESVFLREGKTHVYLVKEGKATLTPVELGIRKKELVEITSGITTDDQVIVRGQTRLYPGAPVKIASENQDKQDKA